MTKRRPALALATLLSLSLTLVGCTDGSSTPETTPDRSSATPTSQPESMTLGVYGTAGELKAWDAIVTDFNDGNTDAQVELVPWSSHEEAREALEAAGDDATQVPDVFMAGREDVSLLLDQELNRPVAELLDERGVDFGDRFSRDAVESFSREGDLQCMGYSISPTVMYINTGLVNFEVMAKRGLDVTERPDRWSLAEFAEAARFGTRPARGGAGVHIDATVEGLAPFLVSAGGTLFDDPMEPTSLNFSSGESRDALEQALAVLRDASLMLTEEQLAKRPALEWFKRGKLAMIAGQRDLVPELRALEGFQFDVKPMPHLGTAATVGDANGLCISAAAESPAAAADLIAHLVGDEASTTLAEVGASVPANLAVAGSDAFVQKGMMPKASRIFVSTIRGMVFPPGDVTWRQLQRAVAPYLRQLFLDPGEIDLEEVTTQIDEASRKVLSPESVTPSPTPTPGSTPSATPGD